MAAQTIVFGLLAAWGVSQVVLAVVYGQGDTGDLKACFEEVWGPW